MTPPRRLLREKDARYRYVNDFTDRHGRRRVYFRYPGRRSEPLPPIGTPEFLEKYAKLLREIGEPVPALPGQGPFVYFASANEMVKIGTTRCVETRIARLQTANPHPLTLEAVAPGGVPEEVAVHSALKALRVRGEWFRREGRVVDIIRHVKRTGVLPPEFLDSEDDGEWGYA